jgi:hypothetical protein
MTKLMQWALNGREKVVQVSIFHLNGVVPNYSFLKIPSLLGFTVTSTLHSDYL